MNHICSNHIQNANISSFIRTWQSIKYWLKVSTKPSNCHFSDRRANLGCGCLQHWELDLDCCSSTQGDFHARSPAVQHSDRGISLFKAHAFFFSWRSHPSSSFFLFFFFFCFKPPVWKLLSRESLLYSWSWVTSGHFFKIGVFSGTELHHCNLCIYCLFFMSWALSSCQVFLRWLLTSPLL